MEYTTKEKALISIKKIKEHMQGFTSYKDYSKFSNMTRYIEEYIKELENMKGVK